MEKREAFNPADFAGDFTRVLRDYWERFLFLLPNIFFALLILALTFLVAGKVHGLLSRRLSGRAHDQITAGYVAVVSRWVVMIVGLLLAFQALGLTGIAGGLLASAGLSAVVIGFAFKDIAQNFLAGLILAFNRPFNVRDTVQITDLVGKIVSLDLRTTHIQTFDGKDVFIPNGIILTTPVTNFTRNGKIRLEFIVGIDYNDPIDEAIPLIEKTVLGIPEVLQQDPPFAVADELAASTVNIKVLFWTETDDYKKGVLQLKSRVIGEVKRTLLENGFGLPATIQELKLYDRTKSLPVELVNELSENGKSPGAARSQTD